ncbi:MAG: hypothetical protein KDD45_04480 [Bdellovibrionales bacterium]|nr:hypothetical protein [Bdellovibrionales bacterium]
MKKNDFNFFDEATPENYELQVLLKAKPQLAKFKNENSFSRRWILWFPPAFVLGTIFSLWIGRKKSFNDILPEAFEKNMSLNTNLNAEEKNFISLSKELNVFDQLDLVAAIDHFETIEYIDEIQDDDWNKI